MKMNLTFSIILYSAAILHAADIYVATNGSDTARGTASQPFRSIQKGLDVVASSGGTVTVGPGVFREELTIRSQQPVTLKTAQPQATILDGAERVQGWRLLDETQNVWFMEFGPPAPYNNDHGRWDMAPRSEQVFVNGQRCKPMKAATPFNAMLEFSFTATLTDPARYTLKLPHGMNPNAATTEITVKMNLLNVRADHVVVDGFVFRRTRNTYQQAMVTLHGEAIEFRNNLVEYSSAGSGLAIQTKRAHVHDNSLLHNGQFGFALGGSDNLVENNRIQGNDLAGYKEWGTGGTKIVGSGNNIRRNRFLDNLGGVAIWLDCGPCNNRIEYNYVSGNYGEGIRAEISFHSFIGYNIIENTKPCTSTMFGHTQTHCIGISVQNSAEICVVNNFLKDNHGVGIQLATYNRDAKHLPPWQRYDKRQIQWIHQSWTNKFICAYSNLFFNNVILQTTVESTNPCVYCMGLLNEPWPHCQGNRFDYNFYWNSLTHAPKVRVRDVTEVPNSESEWQTRYGMDAHVLGGFVPDDYRQPAFGAEYPYQPTASFSGSGKGRNLQDLPWRSEGDYQGTLLNAGAKPSVGHIEPRR